MQKSELKAAPAVHCLQEKVMRGDVRGSLQSNKAGIRKAEEEALILKRQQKVQGFWKAGSHNDSLKKRGGKRTQVRRQRTSLGLNYSFLPLDKCRPRGPRTKAFLKKIYIYI